MRPCLWVNPRKSGQSPPARILLIQSLIGLANWSKADRWTPRGSGRKSVQLRHVVRLRQGRPSSVNVTGVERAKLAGPRHQDPSDAWLTNVLKAAQYRVPTKSLALIDT